MNYEEIINGYNDLREKCLKLAKENPKEILDTGYWLRNAISESDITLYFYEDFVECSGSTYTNQTMDHEYFNFRIPMDVLKESNA